MNLLKHFLFVMKQRRAGNRGSFSAYIKGHEKIELGRGCKIHADASVDASRSPGVRFGDKVTLNRYAYVQDGDGGVRLNGWSEAQAAAAATRAPWLAAGPLAALWQEAQQGRGNVRLMYTFAVLLAWLGKYPLDL